VGIKEVRDIRERGEPYKDFKFEKAILELLLRRPYRVIDISLSMGVDIEEVKKYPCWFATAKNPRGRRAQRSNLLPRSQIVTDPRHLSFFHFNSFTSSASTEWFHHRKGDL